MSAAPSVRRTANSNHINNNDNNNNNNNKNDIMIISLIKSTLKLVNI